MQNKLSDIFSNLTSFMNMILIQHIETVWTRQSRGMPGSAKRNAVARAMNLPDFPEPVGQLLIHKAIARETSNFTMEESHSFQQEMTYWTLEFLLADNKLDTRFTYNYREHGEPNRGAYPVSLFKLNPSEWGSFQINGRFSSHNRQYYRQHFINILFADFFTNDIFVSGKARYQINKLADLF